MGQMMSEREAWRKILGVTIIVALVLWMVGVSGCFVSEAKAVRALRASGFVDIKITNRSWFLLSLRGCGEGDSVRFTATATDPRGEKVDVYLCAGLLKGATVRAD